MNIEELKQKLAEGDAEAIEILKELIFKVDETKIKIDYRTRENVAEILKEKWEVELSKEALDQIMWDYHDDWDSLQGDVEDFLDNQEYNFVELEANTPKP